MPFVIQWVDHCPGDKEIVKINTPVGQLVLVVHGDVIVEADWEPKAELEQSDCIHSLQAQLQAYWVHPEKAIHIKLLKQGSDFRKKVWAELCQIPFGETVTYSALARKIDSAARAVGGACRHNPYALFIPCHRVVAVAGIGGYSGKTEGEFMTIKLQLLSFEANHNQ
jgi:methylated-DNA-[protein]-cysteine S-methyltransferase